MTNKVNQAIVLFDSFKAASDGVTVVVSTDKPAFAILVGTARHTRAFNALLG
jgi:hypothetical protein